MNNITVTPGDPRDPQATALLEQSHALMQSLFDAEDNHYLEISELCVPSITFFVARVSNAIVGCAAIANKETYGEIKSMFVSPDARGKGISHLLMQALDAEAHAQGLDTLKLETGNKLTEAHKLYHAHGFLDCKPFGDYEANNTSIFMSKSLI